MNIWQRILVGAVPPFSALAFLINNRHISDTESVALFSMVLGISLFFAVSRKRKDGDH